MKWILKNALGDDTAEGEELGGKEPAVKRGLKLKKKISTESARTMRNMTVVRIRFDIQYAST